MGQTHNLLYLSPMACSKEHILWPNLYIVWKRKMSSFNVSEYICYILINNQNISSEKQCFCWVRDGFFAHNLKSWCCINNSYMKDCKILYLVHIFILVTLIPNLLLIYPNKEQKKGVYKRVSELSNSIINHNFEYSEQLMCEVWKWQCKNLNWYCVQKEKCHRPIITGMHSFI